LCLLLGLPLELGEADTQLGELVREAEALRLDGQGAVMRDLLRLALEAIQNLAEERREHVLGRSGRGQLGAYGGAGEEGGAGVTPQGLVFARF
jgi:hypothetical protein